MSNPPKNCLKLVSISELERKISQLINPQLINYFQKTIPTQFPLLIELANRRAGLRLKSGYGEKKERES